MKGTVNRVTLIGNVGKDPEIKEAGGIKICNLSLATTERTKEGERTEWHRVTFFNKLAEIVDSFVGKGSKIYVEGKLQTRKWTDSNGIDRYSTEVIADEMQMLNGKHMPAEAVPEEPKPLKVVGLIPDIDTQDIPF